MALTLAESIAVSRLVAVTPHKDKARTVSAFQTTERLGYAPFNVYPACYRALGCAPALAYPYKSCVEIVAPSRRWSRTTVGTRLQDTQ